jgi:hypothetical protein
MTSVRVTLTRRDGTTIQQVVDLSRVLAPLKVGHVVPFQYSGRQLQCEVKRIDSSGNLLLLFLEEVP